MNIIEIWQPRWKDRKVLISIYKVGEHNLIKFTKTPSLRGKYFRMSGKKIREYPVTTNGKIRCYEVPLADLEEVVLSE